MQARVESDDKLVYVVLESDELTAPVTFKADDQHTVIDQAWHFLQERGYDSEASDEILQEALMNFEMGED